MRYWLSLIGASLALLSIFTTAGHANTYPYHIELSAKKSITSSSKFSRNIARLSTVIPITQSDDSIGFLSVIGMRDTKHNLEGNFGFGYRKIFSQRFIMGGYAFYDLRNTKYKHNLQQITAGIEFLTDYFESRVNVYTPFGKQVINSISIYNITATQFSKRQISEQEIGIPGFDLEIGGTLPKHRKLSGFITYYRFAKNNLDSYIGFRLRSSYAVMPWLHIDGEANFDRTRKFVYYAGITLQWKVGLKQKHQSLLHSKMTQLPVRDIDILSSTQTVNKKIHDFSIPNGVGIIISPQPGDSVSASQDAPIASNIPKLVTLAPFSDIWIDNGNNILRGSAGGMSDTQAHEIYQAMQNGSIPAIPASTPLRIATINKRNISVLQALADNTATLPELIASSNFDNVQVATYLIRQNTPHNVIIANGISKQATDLAFENLIASKKMPLTNAQAQGYIARKISPINGRWIPDLSIRPVATYYNVENTLIVQNAVAMVRFTNQGDGNTYYLLGERRDHTWALPGGGVDGPNHPPHRLHHKQQPDNSYQLAATRELREETGLDVRQYPGAAITHVNTIYFANGRDWRDGVRKPGEIHFFKVDLGSISATDAYNLRSRIMAKDDIIDAQFFAKNRDIIAPNRLLIHGRDVKVFQNNIALIMQDN